MTASDQITAKQHPGRAATFSPALHEWARNRAVHLADEFMRHRAGLEDPAAFFAGICAKETLLLALRDSAEPAFMERVTAMEGRHG